MSPSVIPQGGIPRGPGNSIGIVSWLPQRARRVMGLLAPRKDSHYGSTILPGYA